MTKKKKTRSRSPWVQWRSGWKRTHYLDSELVAYVAHAVGGARWHVRLNGVTVGRDDAASLVASKQAAWRCAQATRARITHGDLRWMQ